MGCCCSKEAVEDDETQEVRKPLLSDHREESTQIPAAHSYQAVQDTPPAVAPETGQSRENHAAHSTQDPPVPTEGEPPPPHETISLGPGTLEKPLHGPGDEASPEQLVKLEQVTLQKSAAEVSHPQSSELFYSAAMATQQSALLDLGPPANTTSDTGVLVDPSPTSREPTNTGNLKDAPPTDPPSPGTQASEEPSYTGASKDTPPTDPPSPGTEASEECSDTGTSKEAPPTDHSSPGIDASEEPSHTGTSKDAPPTDPPSPGTEAPEEPSHTGTSKDAPPTDHSSPGTHASEESFDTGASKDAPPPDHPSLVEEASTAASHVNQEQEEQVDETGQVHSVAPLAEAVSNNGGEGIKTAQDDDIIRSKRSKDAPGPDDQEIEGSQALSEQENQNYGDCSNVDHAELYVAHEQKYKDLKDAIRNLQVMYPQHNPDKTIYGCLRHVKNTCGDCVKLDPESSFQVQYVEDEIDHSIIPALLEVDRATELVKDLLDAGPSLAKMATDSITKETALYNSEQNASSKVKLDKLKSVAEMISKGQEYATDSYKRLGNSLQMFKASTQTDMESQAEVDRLQQTDHSEESLELDNNPETLTLSPDDDTEDSVLHSVQEQSTLLIQDEGKSSASSESSTHLSDPSDISTESKSEEDEDKRHQQSLKAERNTETRKLEADSAGPDDVKGGRVADISGKSAGDSLEVSREDDPSCELPSLIVHHHDDESSLEQTRQADEEFETPRFNSTMYDQSLMSPAGHEDRTLDVDHTLDQTGSSPGGQGLLEPDGTKTRLLSIVSSTGYETAQDDTFNMTEYQDFESETSTEVSSRDETISVHNQSESQNTAGGP